MKNNNLLNISKLNMSYSNLKIFNDFELSIENSEKIVLLGQSGSGKSTLAKIIMGLLPQSANIASGELDFSSNNQSIHMDLSKKFLKWNMIRGSKIALIFQDASQSLNPKMKIISHFKEVMLFHKICNKDKIYEQSKQLLLSMMFDNPDKVLESYPHQLSGGMCQRVCIAIALSMKPALLLADEPTSSLDALSRKEVLQTLKNIHNQSVLLITHDISVAEFIADKIIVLNKGIISEIGTTEEIFNAAKDDYTKKLINSYYNIEKLSIDNTIIKDDNQVVLEIKNINKNYGKQNILDNLSFKMYNGEVLGILGESGCGKSTLSRVILGLESDVQGQIIYKGEDILNVSKKRRRELCLDIQLIFQEPRSSLNPRYSAIEIVIEPLIYNNIYEKKDRIQLAKKLLDKVGIVGDEQNRRPPQLSTGQCQRIAIARAIIINPKILICDEIVSSLDVHIQLQILELLLKLKKDYNYSILMISHDIHVLRNICDEIAVMKDGKFLEIRKGGSEFDKTENEYTKKFIL